MNRRIFILIFLLLITTVLIGSASISATLAVLLEPLSQGALLTVWIVPAALTLLFIGALVGNAYVFNPFSRVLYMVTAVWMGTLVYLLLAAFITALVFWTSYGNLVGFSAYILAILVSIYGFLHARNIKIKNVEIKIDNIPEIWKKRTMVFVSDLHLGQVHAKHFTQKVVKMINAQKPDIVAIGGDLFDGSVPAISDSADPLRQITAPLGTYFVTGNHEEFSEDTPFIVAAQNAELKVLENSKVEIDGLQIVGVHYSRAENRENFTELLNTIHIDRAKPSILLKHEPKDVDVAREAGISLQLSGHTHHAQVWPFRFIPKRIYKGFDYGLKKDESIQVYTSSGIGTWGPPLRVGTDSELVVITFV